MSIKQIIENIIEERKQKGERITKKDIADYLGISRQNFVNKLEKLDCELVIKGKTKEYRINY